MRFGFRMALIDAKASRGRFAFIVLAIAAGVAALTGVKGFSESVRYTLNKEARTLMGADLMLRMTALPTDSERAFLNTLADRGIDYTVVTETVSMAGTSVGAVPVLSSIKAADLRKYPFYGVMEFEPASPELSANTVIVSDDLLFRLNVHPGDFIKVGQNTFRIAGISRKEPDRMTTGFTLGPRVLMSREGFEAAGLSVPGSRATQRILLKLPADIDLGQIRKEVEQFFGRRARVLDYSESNPTLSRNMDRASSFLAMVSLIALIVGGVGVATSIESHIQQRMDYIAIMKCLGGRSRKVMQIYVAQSLMLGLVGSLIGVGLGFIVQAAFPSVLADYFDLHIDLIFSWKPFLQGLSVGMLTTLLFTLPPLLLISEIRPALIFRRNMIEQENRRGRRRFAQAVSVGAIGVGIWLIAIWTSGSFRIGTYFAGGLTVSLLVLTGIAKALLIGLRISIKRWGVRLPGTIRQSVANLYRPGAHSTAILVSIGIGAMFTLSVRLLQTSLLDQLRISAPPDAPNVFLINVTANEKDALWDLLRSEPTIQLPDASPAVAGQLTRINGTPVEQIQIGESEQRYFRTQFALTWAAALPKATEILSGRWWLPDTSERLVSVEENAAESLRLKVGDILEWSIQGRPVSARVGSTRRTDASRVGANNQFILTPVCLEGFPVIYSGALRAPASDVPRIQRDIFNKFPTVTVINAADVLDIIQDVVDRISLTVRFLAGFAIFGGVVILASSVAGTRYRRMREVAILKTIGATRRKIAEIVSFEFAILGLAAGTIGALLAGLFCLVVIERVFHDVWLIQWTPLVVSAMSTAGLAVAAGWVSSFRILRQKPLEVLRQADN